MGQLLNNLIRIFILMAVMIISGETGFCWQQKVDYSITALLDDEGHVIDANETIIYHNNSPDTLNELYFHLYANAFADKNSVFAQEAYIAGDDRLYFAASDDMGGITITNIIDDNIESHEIEGTLLTIVLKKPLLPNSIT
ncbi:MAG: M1 family metallopeptidase, partial [candidate division Zixibacteria bacterium]|nr:M1 family metallopeptidase [candidate division Zixibacteria bacterium]